MIPALEKWLLIAVVMLNAYSLGADCVERFVNYGSWHGLSESDFASYHQSQQPAILAFVVAPLGISFLLQLALLWKHPSPIRTGAVWVMILSSLVGAVSTAAASDPHPSSARSRLFPGANLTPDEDRLDPKSSRRHQDHRFRVSSARMPTIEETSLIRPSQLRSVPLFDCFDDGYLEDICMMTADVVLPSGEYLFFEGDPAAFYILLEGTVELSQFVVRNRHVLGTYQSGEFFGRGAAATGLESPVRRHSAHSRSKSREWIKICFVSY